MALIGIDEKVYCKDCGAELQTFIHQQMVKPFHSYLYFNCPGRCHVETCKRDGIDPEKIHCGTPKFYIQLTQGKMDREEIDLRAQAILAKLGRRMNNIGKEIRATI